VTVKMIYSNETGDNFRKQFRTARFASDTTEQIPAMSISMGSMPFSRTARHRSLEPARSAR
jgi:hypothetical protein